MKRPHKDGHLSAHYPCEECEHINLRNNLEFLGITWDMQHLQGKILIESLEHKINSMQRFIQIEKSLLD